MDGSGIVLFNVADKRKGVKKSFKNINKDATKSRDAASSNKFVALDKTVSRKCATCNDPVDEN